MELINIIFIHYLRAFAHVRFMRILTLILAIFFSLSLFAQGSKRDIVYLKNGSIVRGTILLQDPGKLIKLKTPDRNLWVFTYDQIDSIKRVATVKSHQKKGYANLTEVGVLAGNSNNIKTAPFTLMNVNSWQFANGFSTGIGLGVEFFNETYLPVVADFRYYLRKPGPLPFLSVQAGYAIPLGGEFQQQLYYADPLSNGVYTFTTQTRQDVSARGGFIINPSIGILTQINENLFLTFSAGYSYQRHRYGKHDLYKMDVDYNRLSLKVGLQFK